MTIPDSAGRVSTQQAWTRNLEMGAQIDLGPITLLNGRVRLDPADLLSHSRAESEGVVVLSGTLLEGIGNLYSDLDLYVIGEQLPQKGAETLSMQVVREDGRVRRVNETL